MHDSENDFEPLLIDQQIEHPAALLPRGEARLVQDLQAMYDQEKSDSIDQVWTRLAQRRTAASWQPRMLPLQEERQRFERNSHMLHIDQSPVTSTQKKSFPRLLGLIAAALVSLVLVGSMALVFTALKGKTPTTVVGSHDASPTVHASVTTTTPVIPLECKDYQDQADEMLCSTHAETILNVTKNFGTHRVTFVRAYADTARLILIYTTSDSPTSDAISFMNLKAQPGVSLTGGSSSAFQNPETHQWYYLLDFDVQTVPAGTTALHILSIADGFSGQPTPLNFTIPLHTASKVVPVKQTVTSQGISLTLDHLRITGSTTSICLSMSQAARNDQMLSATISINGQQLTDDSDRPVQALPRGDSICGSSTALTLYQALLNRPGSWTVQVTLAPIGIAKGTRTTWTFHFTVPK